MNEDERIIDIQLFEGIIEETDNGLNISGE